MPKDKNTDITAARYRIESSADPEKLRALCEKEQINIEKRTKKGSAIVDLKQLMTDVELDGNVLRVRGIRRGIRRKGEATADSPHEHLQRKP